MPVSVALFASGIGTLIYMISTAFKVPVYLVLHSPLSQLSLAMKEMEAMSLLLKLELS